MEYGKLRIVWSVFWGVATMLLVALCVRGRNCNDFIFRTTSNGRQIFAYSDAGSVGVVYRVQRSNPATIGWSFASEEKVEWERKHDAGFNKRFKMQRSTTTWNLGVPNCFPPMLTGSVALLPWLRRQFSLRSLLITTTLVAVGLGLIVWASQ